MAVTSPDMCGFGGDLFALVAPAGAEPVALNASGRAPSGADAAALVAEGHQRMPPTGDIRAVTVPGMVDGLISLHARFGSRPLDELLEPARRLAAEGFPVSPTLATLSGLLSARTRELAFGAADPLVRGARLAAPGMATLLAQIGRDGRDAFYRGPAGADLIELGEGLFSPADLAARQAEWVAPLSIEAFGHRLWTTPPNSQGYVALSAAWIAERLGIPPAPDGADWAFLLVEAIRQAAYDRGEVLHEHADGGDLLASTRLAPRADAVREHASAGLGDRYSTGDTTYLCAVDGERMGVSLIMSNAFPFGSQLVLPRHGVFLQNRGIGFSLAERHPARYGPHARPPHTLSPLLLTHLDGSLAGVAGTMGADAQPQVLLQLLARMFVTGQRAGDALDAPRWYLSSVDPDVYGFWRDADQAAPTVQLEHHAPVAWEQGLARRGYQVKRDAPGEHAFGHAQLILCTDHDLLCGAADPRTQNGACVGV